MLEKKIANKLHNQELDPQDSSLFEKIMEERGRRNGKAGFLLLGSIALMFIMITGFSVSKYWGEIPTDGYSQEEIAQIRARESDKNLVVDAETENYMENKLAVSNQAISPEIGKVNDAETASSENKDVIAKSSKQNVTHLSSNTNVDSKTSVNSETVESNKQSSTKKHVSSGTTIKANLDKKIKPKSIIAFDFDQRTLKPLDTGISPSNSDAIPNPSEPTDGEGKNEENTNKSLINLWPRELNFYAGAYYNQRFINANNNKMAQMINDYEVITSTNVIGFSAEYHLQKSIFAQLGFQWLTVNSTIQDYSIQHINHRQVTVVDPGGSTYTRDLYDTSNRSVIGGNNTNQYFEVPLTIGARWQIKRHIIQPQFGVVGSFYTVATGWDFTNSGELQTIDGKQDRLKNVNLHLITGFSYTYMVGQNIGLYANPNLRYGITNQTKKSFGFGEYNSMIGCQIGIKYILK